MRADFKTTSNRERSGLAPAGRCWSPRCDLSACPAKLDARLPNSMRPSSHGPTNLPMMTTLFRMVTILMITFVTCCPMRECIGRCASRLRLVAQPHRTTSRRPGTRPSLCHHPTQTHRAQVCTCACDVAHRRRETERQSSYVDLSGHSTYRQLHYRDTIGTIL